MRPIRKIFMVITMFAAATVLTGPVSEAVEGVQIKGYHTAKCLVIPQQYGTGNGSDAESWTCSATHPSHRWRFVHVGYGGPTNQHRIYKIINIWSNRCLEAENNSPGNGTTVQQWDCSPARPGILWYIERADTPWAKIRLNVRNDDRRFPCLEIEGSSTSNGADAQIWTCDAQNGTHWSKSGLPPSF